MRSILTCGFGGMLLLALGCSQEEQSVSVNETSAVSPTVETSAAAIENGSIAPGSSSTPSSVGADMNWPQWRGPSGNGVALAGNPPIEWSEEKNVVWKIPVPGRGHSTPIIWGEQLFLLTAVPENGTADVSIPLLNSKQVFGQQRSGRGGGRGGFGAPIEAKEHDFVTISYDRTTGEELWRRSARKETPHEGMSGMGSSEHGYASGSPVTDGTHLYSYFGSRGLYCYGMDGELVWEKDLGDMKTRNAFGEGASPALAGDVLVIVWDEEGDSFIYALDKNSGEILWKKPRNERSSWSTPSIIEFEDQTQVVVNGTEAVRSYDLKSGDLIWECSGQTANAIPSPVHQDGIVIAMSGFRGNALHAIQLGKKGVLTDTDAVVWSHDRGTPYVPSPLLFDDKLWFCQKNDGILSCFGATSGEAFYSQERLGIRGVYASPIAAGNRVYIAGRDGNTVVVENSTQFKILKTNRLEEKFDASPVVVGDYLYLRGQNNLYCIGESEG